MLRSNIPKSADSIKTDSSNYVRVNFTPIKRRDWTTTVWSGILSETGKIEKPCLELNRQWELRSMDPFCRFANNLQSMQTHRSDFHYFEVSTLLL